MKISELDLSIEGKKYFCRQLEREFIVKNGDLTYLKTGVSLASTTKMRNLFLMDFEEIEIEEMSNNPYGRVNYREQYHCLAKTDIRTFMEEYYSFDDELFNIANYFNNKEYAEYIAFKESLMRRMDRFAWEHNSQVIDWNDETQKFFIYYSLINKKFKVDFTITMQDNNIYFSSREVAEKALEEFKEDLLKLYTWKFELKKILEKNKLKN